LKAHVAAATVYMRVMQSSLFTHCRCIDGLYKSDRNRRSEISLHKIGRSEIGRFY